MSVKAKVERNDVVCLQLSRLTVTTDPTQKLVVDGELLEGNPIEFECVPRGLTIFLPMVGG